MGSNSTTYKCKKCLDIKNHSEKPHRKQHHQVIFRVKTLKQHLNKFVQQLLKKVHFKKRKSSTQYYKCQYNGISISTSHSLLNLLFPIMDWALPRDPAKSDAVISSESKLLIGSMMISKPQYQVLLVFPKEDRYFRLLSAALTKLGFKYESAKNVEEANMKFHNNQHHLIIVDFRHGSNADSESFCRNLRTNYVGSFTTVVALISRRYRTMRSTAVRLPCFLKCSYSKRSQMEEITVKDLLQMGYNRVITETTILDDVEDELMQIEAEPLANQTKFRSCQALFTALERTTYSILIADETQKIQFVNKIFEKGTGLESKQVIGGFINEFFTIDARNPSCSGDMNDSCTWERIKELLQSGKEWSGRLSIKRQSGDEMQLHGLLLPLSSQTGVVQQYVMVMNLPGQHFRPTSESSSSSASLHPPIKCSTANDPILPPRRPSATISEGDCKHNRANSLAKIQSMAIEAPITQIINLIDRVKHNSQPSVGEVLDQILEILRNSELYSPADLQNKAQDPMVTDLIEGLVTGSAFGHRRPSGGQTVLPKTTSGLLMNPSSPTAFDECKDPSLDVAYLEHFESWDYNIFELEKITLKRPLVHMGMHALNKFNVCSVLQCSQETLHSWLTGIESKYHASNPYHNSTHAADVLHATAFFLNKDRLQSWMEPIDQAAILLAAIIHDVDHPGKTNTFLINTCDPLALMYNDTAVLEMHHAAFAFKFTVNDDESNIFKNMPRENFMTLRQSMIDMVLATELTKHFEHVNKFISIVTKSHSNAAAAVLDQDAPHRSTRASSNANSKETQDLKNLIKRVMIKVADVCNPVKKRDLCVEWARRISEEYFAQTDEEKKLGLAPSLPLFDRNTCNLPKSQSSFIEWFLIDMCEAWHEFCGIEELVTNLHDNHNYWKQLEIENIKATAAAAAVATTATSSEENQHPLAGDPEKEVEAEVAVVED